MDWHKRIEKEGPTRPNTGKTDLQGLRFPGRENHVFTLPFTGNCNLLTSMGITSSHPNRP